MNKLTISLIWIACLFMTACGHKEEPYADLFSIGIKLDEQGGEVLIIKHECEVAINGEQQYVKVSLSGDFENLNLRPPYSSHEWSMVTIGEKDMSILVLKNSSGVERRDNVDFVVSKGSVKNEGTISIVQYPNKVE